jgi:CHRD domain-containing protein
MAPRSVRNLGGLAVAAIGTLGLLIMGVPADADTRLFLAHLTGAQETPPTGAATTGDAVVVLDTVTNQIHYVVTHDVASPIMAHFHGNGFPGTAAPILVPIGTDPATSASPIVGSAALTAPQANDLLSGRWYVNVHSSTYTGGEIRGQLASVSDAPVTLFPGPGAGHLARTTAFDVTVFLKTGTTVPVGASITVNGGDVTSAFLSCVRPGTLAGGGVTLRCPLPGGVLAPGQYFLSVVIHLSDGNSVGSTATWVVDNNTEP